MARALDLEREAKEYLSASARIAGELAGGALPGLAARAAILLGDALGAGGKVMFCGNGGSAADAQHLAAELVGCLDRRRDRGPLAGLALTTDTSALTALANDFGYEEVFARQVRALGRPGDALICLSTSGASSNVIRAAEAARSIGIAVVGLVGPGPSPLDELAAVCLHVRGEESAHVQQGHITVGHLLCSLVEGMVGSA